MPRQIPKKDCIKIYYAYRLGIDQNGVQQFGAIKSCDAYFSDRSGGFEYARYGSETDYGTRLILQDSEATKYFDEYTKIWVFSTPTSSDEQPDYIIKNEPTIRDGQIMFECDSVAVNNRQLYYLYGNAIIRFTAIFNESAGVFYTPTNVYLPIDKSTKMWFTEPDDAESDEDVMVFVSKRSRAKYNEYNVRIVEPEPEENEEEPQEGGGE